MPTVTPKEAPEPRSFLGYDGANFFVLKTDSSGHLIVRGEDQFFSFQDTLEIRVEGNPSGAGGYLETGAVPEGEIWVVTHVAGADLATAVTRITAERFTGGVGHLIGNETKAFAIGEPVVFLTESYLKEDDTIRCWYVGSLAGDTCALWVTGYIMTVET